MTPWPTPHPTSWPTPKTKEPKICKINFLIESDPPPPLGSLQKNLLFWRPEASLKFEEVFDHLTPHISCFQAFFQQVCRWSFYERHFLRCFEFVGKPVGRQPRDGSKQSSPHTPWDAAIRKIIKKIIKSIRNFPKIQPYWRASKIFSSGLYDFQILLRQNSSEKELLGGQNLLGGNQTVEVFNYKTTSRIFNRLEFCQISINLDLTLRLLSLYLSMSTSPPVKIWRP